MYLILEEGCDRVNMINDVLLLPKARLRTGSRSEAKAMYVTAHVKGAGLPTLDREFSLRCQDRQDIG